MLLSQPSLFDPTRAPAGRHTAWAYCHVPNGSTVDMTARIEAQVERFAPGFRDTILARHVMAPADFQSYNENYIGGDINGGAQDIRQLFTRPVARLVPYSTPWRRALSLLVVDAARRRRAWTVRISRSAGRARADLEFEPEVGTPGRMTEIERVGVASAIAVDHGSAVMVDGGILAILMVLRKR